MTVGKRVISLFLVVGILVSLYLVSASAPGPIGSCQVLDTSGVYTLNRSLIDENVTGVNTCMNITSSNVELDCVGYIIKNTTFVRSGILASNVINITIRNCNVTVGYSIFPLPIYGIGIYLSGVNNSLIINNTANNNSYGIYLDQSSFNNLTKNTESNGAILATDSSGIYLIQGSNDNIVVNNTANSDIYGVYLSSSHRNSITNSVSNNSGGVSVGAGFYLTSSNNNTIVNVSASSSNTFAQAGLYLSTSNNNIIKNSSFNLNNAMSVVGIYLIGSNNNNISLSMALSNGGSGIYLTGSNNNTITDFIANGSTSGISTPPTGIYLTGSSNNLIVNLTAKGNGQNGIHLISSSNNNLIINSTLTLNTLYGLYIQSSYNNTIFNSNLSYNSGYNAYLNGAINNSLLNISAISLGGGFGTQTGLFLTSSSFNYINGFTTTGQANTIGDSGIHIASSNNNNFTNIISNSNTNGFAISSSNNNSFNNITANSNIGSLGSVGMGFYITSSNGNLVVNASINNNYNSANGPSVFGGIYLSSSSNNTFIDTSLSNNSGGANVPPISANNPMDVYLVSSSSNNTFLNVTYNVTENITSGSMLIRKWYLNVNVSDYGNGIVNNSNVSALNVSGVIQDNSLTASSQVKLILTQYIKNGTLQISYNPYTVTANASGYTLNSSSFTINSSTTLNVLTVFLTDLFSPQITLSNLSDAYNTTSRNLNFNFTATDNTLNNLNCSIYVDGIFKSGNTTVTNGTLTNLIASSIADGNHYWNITCIDQFQNSNVSSTRIFTVDNAPPSVSGIIYVPSLADDIDPNANITLNATVSDSLQSISTIILQVHNGTSWFNRTMISQGNNIYQANFSLVSVQQNYTFNIWANDSLGNLNITTNQTFQSYWDCTWNLSTNDFGVIPGWQENKFITNITITNTGDSQYSQSSCGLLFYLNHNLENDRVYFNNQISNSQVPHYFTPSTLAARSNVTISINASFTSTSLIQEGFSISVYDQPDIASTNLSSVNGTLLTTVNRPYLYVKVTNPASKTLNLNLTKGNVTISGYLQNLAGNSSQSTIAFNVSSNWTIPSLFLLLNGNTSLFFANISNSSQTINPINITFNETNLPNLSPGSYNIYLYARGYNFSAGEIINSNNESIISDLIQVSLFCYNVSDGIEISSCGNLDPDNPVTNTTNTITINTGGGGGGGGTAGPKASYATFNLVRGKINEFNMSLVNPNGNQSLTNVEFSILGDIAKYIEVSPGEIKSIPPSGKEMIKLRVNAPSYLELGANKVTLKIRGELGNSGYAEDRLITFNVFELSKVDAQKLLDQSIVLLNQLKSNNLSSNALSLLLNESTRAISSGDYGKILDNYNTIKDQVTQGIEAKNIIDQLDELIIEAHAKGIKTDAAERILGLAKLSIQRGDYLEANVRVKEAQLQYALAVKGELGSVSYYVKNNPGEISLAALFLIVVSFAGYKVTRLQLLKSRIAKLKEEDAILIELIKLAQKEAFQDKKMDMDEYREAIYQYEKRIVEVVEQLIEAENQYNFALKFVSSLKKTKIERAHLIDLIKQLQIDYLQKGIIESNVYDMKLKSYNSRIGEIDEKFATLEAQKALRKNSGIFRSFFGSKDLRGLE